MIHDTLLPGSALCQSMVTGSRLSTPLSGRVRRPSDVGLRSSSGLPSPQVGVRGLLGHFRFSSFLDLDHLQVLNKNSSLVCSTPTITGSRQARERALPSPITSVKRKV